MHSPFGVSDSKTECPADHRRSASGIARCAVAALNAKRGGLSERCDDETRSLPSAGFAQAGSAGCCVLKRHSQRRNPRPATNLRVCLVFRSRPTVGGILNVREHCVSPGSRFSLAPLLSRSGHLVIHVPFLNVSRARSRLASISPAASSLRDWGGDQHSSLALTVRAAKLPGASAASFLFVTCCLIWNLGGLAHSVALTCGAHRTGTSGPHHPGLSVHCRSRYGPITVLSLWSPLATLHWQRIGCRSLQALAVITCTLIVIPLWHGVLTGVNSSLLFLKESTPYNGAILLTLGIALFRERLISRAMTLPSLAMLVGAFGAMTAVFIQQVLPFDRVVSEPAPRRQRADHTAHRSRRVLLVSPVSVFPICLSVIASRSCWRRSRLWAFTLSYYILSLVPIRGPSSIPGCCPGHAWRP